MKNADSAQSQTQTLPDGIDAVVRACRRIAAVVGVFLAAGSTKRKTEDAYVAGRVFRLRKWRYCVNAHTITDAAVGDVLAVLDDDTMCCLRAGKNEPIQAVRSKNVYKCRHFAGGRRLPCAGGFARAKRWFAPLGLLFSWRNRAWKPPKSWYARAAVSQAQAAKLARFWRKNPARAALVVLCANSHGSDGNRQVERCVVELFPADATMPLTVSGEGPVQVGRQVAARRWWRWCRRMCGHTVSYLDVSLMIMCTASMTFNQITI